MFLRRVPAGLLSNSAPPPESASPSTQLTQSGTKEYEIKKTRRPDPLHPVPRFEMLAVSVLTHEELREPLSLWFLAVKKTIARPQLPFPLKATRAILFN